jgi:hypothetical protein
MTRLQRYNLGYIDHGIGGDPGNNCLWGMPYYVGDNRVFKISLDTNGLVTGVSNGTVMTQRTSQMLFDGTHPEVVLQYLCLNRTIPQKATGDRIFLTASGWTQYTAHPAPSHLTVSVYNSGGWASKGMTTDTGTIFEITDLFTDYGEKRITITEGDLVWGQPMYIRYMQNVDAPGRRIGTTLHYNYSDFTGYYNTYDR